MKKLLRSGEDIKMLTDGNENEGFDNALLSDLALLLNSTVKDIKEDCYLYQIKKFFSKISDVNVRFDVTNSEIEKQLVNCENLNLGDVLISPVYLATCNKISKKNDFNTHYSVIIDFPFGESDFNTKKVAVKDCKKFGVNSITVTLPSVLALPERIKEFKKQTKKIGVMADIPIGVALNASDMTEDRIKDAVKIADKTKVDFITFIFGESSHDVIIKKMKLASKYANKKIINVLGNIDRADIVGNLIKLNVNTIYTPFAHDIAKEIIERFKVTKIKVF